MIEGERSLRIECGTYTADRGIKSAIRGTGPSDRTQPERLIPGRASLV